MGHYVVTTSAHRDPLRGDSLDDCFCTRGVAEMRFEACADAGHDVVRLVRWCEGEATELVHYEAAQRTCPALRSTHLLRPECAGHNSIFLSRNAHA